MHAETTLEGLNLLGIRSDFPLGHLLLILCFRSEKFPVTMWAGSSLFIIHYYNHTFNDQKVAVGGSILAICHGKKLVLVL